MNSAKNGFDPRNLMDVVNPEPAFPLNKKHRMLGPVNNQVPQVQRNINHPAPVQNIAPPEINQVDKKSKVIFSAALLIAERPTTNGNVYSTALCQKLIERFTLKPHIVIQELNPVERQLKGIPLAEPWDKRVMAVVKSAAMVGDVLVITAECRLTRDGKKLSGMLKTLGLDTIEFMPVGYGIPDNLNRIGLDYRLNYIAVQPKK